MASSSSIRFSTVTGLRESIAGINIRIPNENIAPIRHDVLSARNSACEQSSRHSIDNDSNYKLIWDAYDELEEELEDTNIPSRLTPATLRLHAEVEGLLRGLVDTFVSRERSSNLAAKDYLCKKPNHLLPLKFWKLVIIFLKQPKKGRKVGLALPLARVKSLTTVRHLLHQAYGAYYRITQTKVDKVSILRQ